MLPSGFSETLAAGAEGLGFGEEERPREGLGFSRLFFFPCGELPRCPLERLRLLALEEEERPDDWLRIPDLARSEALL